MVTDCKRPVDGAVEMPNRAEDRGRPAPFADPTEAVDEFRPSGRRRHLGNFFLIVGEDRQAKPLLMLDGDAGSSSALKRNEDA